MSSQSYQLIILTALQFLGLFEHRCVIMKQLKIPHKFQCVYTIIPVQCCLGSGWLLEPFEGSETKTLVSYVINVGYLYNYT